MSALIYPSSAAFSQSYFWPIFEFSLNSPNSAGTCKFTQAVLMSGTLFIFFDDFQKSADEDFSRLNAVFMFLLLQRRRYQVVDISAPSVG